MLKRFFIAIMAIFLACAPVVGSADTVMVYGGQNPDANEQNQSFRFQRLIDGTVLRDIVTPFLSTGGWSGMNIANTTGLNVSVQLSPANEIGILYQIGVDSAIAIPPAYPAGFSGPSLLSDSTHIVIPYKQLTNSSNILLTAPGAGDYLFYLIEANGTTAAATMQSQTFINLSGMSSPQNINTQILDTVSFASKAGTAESAGSCPATVAAASGVPGVDSGYTAIGYVCVYHGQSTIPSGQIFMDYGTNVVAGSFATVQFGGPYAQDGNINPSTLTTEGAVAGCGLSAMGGFVLKNQSSALANPYLLASDLNGDVSVCGQTLTIENNGASATGPARIVVNTTLDSGSPGNDTLTPGQGQNHTYRTSSSCTNGNWCGATSGEFICQGVGANTPSAAFVAIESTYAQQLIPTVSIVPSGGLQVNLYNTGGTVGAGTAITYNYVCL